MTVYPTFWISSSSSLDFFSLSSSLSILITSSTCLSRTAAFMISRQFLSTVVNLRPSSGIWAMMSGEEKMGSRYSQVAWTFNHSSRTSCNKISLPSHSLWTRGRKHVRQADNTDRTINNNNINKLLTILELMGLWVLAWKVNIFFKNVFQL
mgnify:CR=1 FL=1